MKNTIFNKRGIVISIVFLFLGFTSCKMEIEKDEVERINIVEGLENSDTLKLSTIVSKIDYIKLETSNESLVSWPDKIDIERGNLVLMDKRTFSFLRFDTTGRYINRIAKGGESLGDFCELGSFFFCDAGTNVYLLNRVFKGEILKYSIDGHFKNVVKKGTGIHIQPNSNGEIYNLYLLNQTNDSNNNTIIVIDTSGNKKADFLPQPGLHKLRQHNLPILNSQIYQYLDSITFWQGRSDTIYRIGANKIIHPRYFLYSGKYKIPTRLLSDRNTFQEEINNYSHIIKFIETNDYFFFNVVINRKMKYVLYNKKEKVATNVFNKTVNLLNDIDKGLPFWPDGILSDGRLYMLIDSKSILELGKSFNLGMSKIGFNLESSSKLSKIINSTKIDDNPILMIVTLK